MGALQNIGAGLTSFLAGLLNGGICFSIVVGALAAGFKIAEVTRRNWIGWIVAPTLIVAAIIIYGPIMDVLTEVSCRTATDHQACIDRDDGDTDY